MKENQIGMGMQPLLEWNGLQEAITNCIEETVNEHNSSYKLHAQAAPLILVFFGEGDCLFWKRQDRRRTYNIDPVQVRS
jgi:hypothetical protein